MPKARKGEFSGKPPVPTGNHDVIDTWIRGLMPSVQPLVRAIDELICTTLCGLDYAIKWSKAHYGLGELGWIIEVAGYHKSANVVFFAGADLDPPPPLGETGRSRYVKLHHLDDVTDPLIRFWIEQAGRIPGWS
jgi:hypothetical protein